MSWPDRARRLFLVLFTALPLALQAQVVMPQLPSSATTAEPTTGPVRLRPATPAPAVVERETPAVAPQRPPYVPGEFEQFVGRVNGTEVRRLGSELVTGAGDGTAPELTSVVPPDYVIAPGDEIIVLLWGSVDADLRLVVDRGGRISIPRVGAVQVAGVRLADLHEVVQRQVGQVFKNFQVSTSLGQLRGIRVFVTGFVSQPGAYTVSALSTVVGALMRAGGPSAAGSFRSVELKRHGQAIGRFDLYDLLLKGDRSADRLLQSGDVVHVGPVGTQVGIIGSVNRPVVAEVLAKEGVADALAMAGGFSAVADRSRVAIERLQQRSTERVSELQLPRDAALPLSHGDVLRAFSAAEAVQSTEKQNKLVRIDGEVARPGEYVLAATSTLQDAVRAAGGFTTSAFVYGAQFTRPSVRATQQENYQRALRDLETDFARASGTQRVSSAEQAAGRDAQAAATARLVERLRALQPDGRVVLQLAPDATEVPALVLEDGDRLYVPPKPTTVGVFGSVFNTGTYLYGDGRTLADYLRLAGGPNKGADEGSIFVVRSNGQVVSARQRAGSSWFGSAGSIGDVRAEPGDTVFVPEEMDKTTFIQLAKDWTQILFQFGLGAAGIKSALN